jgi:hypothetical protein
MTETKQHTARDLAWGVLQRLQFIEFRLLWEGRVNRSDLINTFGISVPQSTLDFREYLERAPNNMDYDKRRRFYYPTPDFKPVFISESAEGYLSQLVVLGTNKEGQSAAALIGKIPSFDILPILDRRVDSITLREILECIRAGDSIEIFYQSLSSQSPGWRRITPHALSSDGLRWHVRAYCHTKGQFLDFVLGRITEIRDKQSSEISGDADTEWNEIIKVTIAPNPALTKEQQKIIERDYAMTNGEAVITLRRSLLFYLKQRLGIEEGVKKSPATQQVVIARILLR